MRNFAAALTALIIVACGMPRGASAQHGGAEAYFSELKARYLRLRNTDVNITRAGEWEALSKQFENFVDQNPRYGGAAFGLYNASILLEQLYRRFGGIDRLQKCSALLERVAAARVTMQLLGAQGVPQLAVAGQGGALRLVGGDALLGPRDALLARVQAAAV